jgi:uncharacterized protein (TIGR00251 family)
MTEPWQLKGDQLTLHCHVQPGARQTRLVGLYDNCLKIQLQSAPVDGKANKALIAFLAKLSGVAKSAVIIKKGLSSRRKTVLIEPVESIPPALENINSA